MPRPIHRDLFLEENPWGEPLRNVTPRETETTTSRKRKLAVEYLPKKKAKTSHIVLKPREPIKNTFLPSTMPRKTMKKRVYKKKRVARKRAARGGGALNFYDKISRPKVIGGAVYHNSSLGRRLMKASGALIGGTAGFFAGGGIGALPGAAGGYAAADEAATLLGMGDYAIKENSLIGCVDSKTGVPHIHSNRENTVIRHREYLGDVASSGTANLFSISNAYPLNPGQGTTFPWLSTIASQYQEYRWRGLIFEYRTTSADAIASSTNTALGNVMMATQYNPAASAFVNKIQLLNEYFSCDTKVSENLIHFIECDPAENPFQIQYVRPGPVPSGGNIQNYDLGNFYIATSGVQGTNNVCGELWVSYEVELYKPLPYSIVNQNYYYNYATTAVSTSNYFGTSQVAGAVQNNWFDGTVALGATTITINSSYAGSFAIMFQWIGGAATCAAPTFAQTTNLINVPPQIFNNGGSSQATGGAVASSTSLVVVQTFAYLQTAANASTVVITLSGGTLPTSVTNMNFLMFAI